MARTVQGQQAEANILVHHRSELSSDYTDANRVYVIKEAAKRKGIEVDRQVYYQQEQNIKSIMEKS
jgi:hypothetical protein